MKEHVIKNAGDPALNTESEILLRLRFYHGKTASSADAARLSRDALLDYCESYGLDVWVKDGEGRRTTEIDDDQIIPAIEEHLQRQLLNIIASHRGSRAEREAQAIVSQTLQASE